MKIKIHQDGGTLYDSDYTLDPAYIESSSNTKSAYKQARKEYRQARRDQRQEERAFNRSLRKEGIISDQDVLDKYTDWIEMMPTKYYAENKYKRLREQYRNSPDQVNKFSNQIRRYIGRKWNNIFPQKTNQSLSGIGADVIDLTKNVQRVTPMSKQSTALFNEFVEKDRGKTVMTAEEYKSNPNRMLSTKKPFPQSNISIYGGIEDGKFKIDSLNNFNNNTTIVPARNIKRGTPQITRLNFNEGNGAEKSDAYRFHLENTLWKNAATWFANVAKVNPQYLESMRNSYKESKRNEDLASFVNQYFSEGNEHYIDLDTRKDVRRFSRLMRRASNPNSHAFETLYDLSPRLRNSLDKHRLRFNWVPLDAEKAKNKYTFIGADGNEYPISDYNAGILDGKTILGGPDGSLFVGRAQDLSNEQINKINEWLKTHPSWLFRTDLGSFEQYRLDNPSLSDYLNQYFEHPNPNDPNIYTVGTSEPNKF